MKEFVLEHNMLIILLKLVLVLQIVQQICSLILIIKNVLKHATMELMAIKANVLINAQLQQMMYTQIMKPQHALQL